jgi:tRNA (guanine37-N1)-methyltransferase
MRPRGLRGELVARSQSDIPGRFEHLEAKARLRDGSDVSVAVERAWQHKGDWVLKLAGVDSIEAAERFRGADVWVAPEDRAELGEGEFFRSDLIGCRLKDGDGAAVWRGSAADGSAIRRRGSADSVCIRSVPGGPDRACYTGRIAGRAAEPVKFDIITIFPEYFASPLAHGVVARARNRGLLDIQVRDLRNWTYDRHRTVDDRPFGGGEGMLLKPEPLFEAVEAIVPGRAKRAELDPATRVVLLSAQGRRFDQNVAREYAGLERLVLICGRYEGVDERVSEHLADEELSVGDFVLSGGELAAAMVVDVVSRLIPGVLGNEDSSRNESFSGENEFVLDCPQYTRPAEFRGWRVPEVLLGGNHEEIKRWRRAAAREKTLRLRPDLVSDSQS